MKAVLFSLYLLFLAVFGKGELSGGESGSTSSGKSNYYLDTFQSSYYIPYAIDECSAYNLAGTTYIKPTCVGKHKVSVSNYTDSSCTSLIATVEHTNASSIFRCDGSDSYMGIQIGLAGTCTAKFYAAINTCSERSALYYSTYTCKGSTKGSLSVSTDTSCSTTALTYNLNSSCEYAFTASSSGVSVDLYWQITDCSASSVVTTSASESSSGETSSGESSGEMSPTPGTGSSSDANTIASKNIIAISVFIIMISFVLF